MQTVKQLQQFLDNSPSPFHAVQQCIDLLIETGFVRLNEHEPWKLEPNGRYFFTKNSSTLVTFRIGSEYQAGNGFAIVGAHTDSPCLKVKPVTKARAKHSFLQLGIQTYGGGLWHTWFDRDLSVAGRVIYQATDSSNTSYPQLHEGLVCINKPMLKIPTLAIHLNKTVDSEGFKFNKETHLVPIAGMIGSDEFAKQAEFLPALLASELKISVDQIQDVEMCLFDCQKSVVGGTNDEFIFSARLDNLLMSFCALQAFVGEFGQQPACASNVSMLVLFDNEEVGSLSAQGADSTLLAQCIERIVASFPNPNAPADSLSMLQQTVARSFFISADCAHSVHPNYSEFHEEFHRPVINGGVVLKVNANQRYATTAYTGAVLKQLAARHSVPLQEFCVKNDSSCGTTIGPIVAGNLAIRTVDVGNPQLSMHSIRETAGVADVDHAIRLFRGFYRDFDQFHFSF